MLGLRPIGSWPIAGAVPPMGGAGAGAGAGALTGLGGGPSWWDWTFGPTGGAGSLTSDRWQLARYLGQRSSVSGFPARPLYRPELCNSSKSLVSSQVWAEGRFLGNRDNRPLYKVNASYVRGSGVPEPASETTWGRLIGSRSSFTSNSSTISGRALYAARPPCKENRTPSSFSPRPSSSSYSNWSFSVYPFGCCPGRTVWPARLRLTIVRTAGTCTVMDAINGMDMIFGPNIWAGNLNTCDPPGYGWYGSLGGLPSLLGVPWLYCQSYLSGSPCRFTFGVTGTGISGPGCSYDGPGNLSYTWAAHDPSLTFLGPTICDSAFPLTGTLTFTQSGFSSQCCPLGEFNSWDFSINVQAEP